MKALLYKEFKLAMHPICYVFTLVFPLMVLIPSYPLGIGFIYVLTCYPVLFLGANKGQQSNDLLYSTLLPVRKKDIVFARMMTCAIMQFVFIALMSALCPLAILFRNNVTGVEVPGLGLDSFGSVVGLAIIGYALADLIFFPIYYKNGKSIVMSTLFTIFGFITYLMIVTVVIPFLPVIGDPYKEFMEMVGAQIGLIGGAILVYILIHIIVYKIASKNLEKVDF